MTIVDTDWLLRAQQLADQLESRGDLRDPAWKSAVAAVARHVLIPQGYRQDERGAWQPLDMSGTDGLDLAYSPTTLVTTLADRGMHQESASSSTKPDLIVRMLELLDVHDENTVLAVGTGSGYTTALLTHRLGNDHVYSVDIDGDLVETARTRLASLGMHPTLATADGAQGLPAHAPYDRIMVTCSVPTVPWSWAGQLSDDGKALVDIKVGNNAGNLALLHKHPNRLEGPFTDRWASFMTMRHEATPTPPVSHPQETSAPRAWTSTTPPNPWWDNQVVWLLAQCHGLPAGTTTGLVLDPDTREPNAGTMTAPDGSTTTVSLHARDNRWEVTETGPTSLWPAVEHAQALHQQVGQPGWGRLGITATARRQWLWIDDPNGPHTWDLPPH